MPFPKYWSDDELAWLKKTFTSAPVREILATVVKPARVDPVQSKGKKGQATGHDDGEFKRAARYIFDHYPDHFKERRLEEPDSNFRVRKAMLRGSGAVVHRTAAESEEEHKARMENLFTVRVPVSSLLCRC